MKYMDYVALATLLVAILGTAFAIYRAMVRREAAAPKIRLSAGCSIDNLQSVPRQLRRLAVTTIVYALDSLERSDVLALCPTYHIRNAGRHPVRNISLLLNYPAKYLVSNRFVATHHEETVHFQVHNDTRRNAETIGDAAQVVLSVPDLRPGENLALTDMMMLRVRTAESHRMNHENATGMIPGRIEMLERVIELCRVHATLLSDQCPPVVQEVTVVWTYASNKTQVDQVLKECTEVAWDGHYPLPGTYFDPLGRLRRRLYRREVCVVVFPAFVWMPFEDSMCLVEVFDRSKKIPGGLKGPPWGFWGPSYDIVERLSVQRA